MIDGLTFKDLSNRNNLSSPHRRWTYDEVSRWLSTNGEFRLSGTDKPLETQNFIYIYQQHKYTSLESLAEQLLKGPEAGKKELARGLMAKKFKQNNLIEATLYCEDAEYNFSHAQEFDSAELDRIYVNLIYTIVPGFTKIVWKNLYFDSLFDYANALIDEVIKVTDQDNDLLNSPEELLNNRLLQCVSANLNDDAYIELFDKFSELRKHNNNRVYGSNDLSRRDSIDREIFALQIGYALTDRRDVMCGGKHFSSPENLIKHITSIHDNNLKEFVVYCKRNVYFLKQYSKILTQNQQKDINELFNFFDKIEWVLNSTVSFGNYWQNSKDIKEPIEWLVLDVTEDNKALLISRYALDCKQYHKKNENITWEQCDLRKWLNSEFINNAFSKDEQKQIRLSEIVNSPNPSRGTTGGNNTKDKIFLLSIEEVNKYFKSNKERECKATKYAIENKAWVKNSNGNCCWWLRSPGYYQYYAAHVDGDGDVNYFGGSVNTDYDALRVALWFNL